MAKDLSRKEMIKKAKIKTKQQNLSLAQSVCKEYYV